MRCSDLVRKINMTKTCNTCNKTLSVELFGLCRGNTTKKEWYHNKCKECTKEQRRTKYRTDETSRLKERSYSRQHYKDMRKSLLEYYGGKCSCCSESTYEFLVFDHINNDGNKHRRQHGTSAREFVFWLKKNLPNDIQVLCHNCNMSRAFYGVCPHNKQLQDSSRNV